MSVVAEREVRRSLFADEIHVALRPATAYTSLLADADIITWNRALERPALALLVLGTAFPIATLGRVTGELVAATTLAWTFALAVQLFAGLALIASVPGRRVALPAAIHLLYAGHAPWSLWLLAAASYSAVAPVGVGSVAHNAVVPVVWTAIILSAFCRVVLGTTRAGAWVRVLVHQIVIYSIALTFVAWSFGGWFRLF